MTERSIDDILRSKPHTPMTYEYKVGSALWGLGSGLGILAAVGLTRLLEAAFGGLALWLTGLVFLQAALLVGGVASILMLAPFFARQARSGGPRSRNPLDASAGRPPVALRRADSTQPRRAA